MLIRTLSDALTGDSPKDSLIANAPLVSVVAQIQFPQILKIKQPDEIAKLQDSLRADYPEIKKQVTGLLNINPLQGISQAQQVTQQFYDDENVWTVSFDENFISLSTTGYTRRQEFLERLAKVVDCFVEQFSPGRTKRIGLRYLNQISGERYRKIGDYINKDLLGVFVGESAVHHMITETALNAKEGKIFARWGILPANGTMDLALLPPKNEPTWIIDIDISSEERTLFQTPKILSVVESFAKRQYAVFSWITSEKLRKGS